MKAVLAAVALLVPALAFAEGDGQLWLLSRLHHDAAFRAELGEYVKVHGDSKQVTAFAATLSRDQHTLDEAVLQYVKDNRLDLQPLVPDPSAERLRTLHGAALDRAFLVWVADTSQDWAKQL